MKIRKWLVAANADTLDARAKRLAMMWFIAAATFMLTDLAFYFWWRSGSDFFHPMLYFGMWICLALHAAERGYLTGLRAGRRERASR